MCIAFDISIPFFRFWSCWKLNEITSTFGPRLPLLDLPSGRNVQARF